MTSGALKILAVVSTLFCLAMIAVWIASYATEPRFVGIHRFREYFIASGHGRVRIGSRSRFFISDQEYRSPYGVQPLLRFGPYSQHWELTAYPDCYDSREAGVLGFASRTEKELDGGDLGMWCGVAIGEIAIPYWFLVLSASVLPCMWGTRPRKERNHDQSSLCRTCAYDLRATPSRCPECGTIASA